MARGMTEKDRREDDPTRTRESTDRKKVEASSEARLRSFDMSAKKKREDSTGNPSIDM